MIGTRLVLHPILKLVEKLSTRMEAKDGSFGLISRVFTMILNQTEKSRVVLGDVENGMACFL